MVAVTIKRKQHQQQKHSRPFNINSQEEEKKDDSLDDMMAAHDDDASNSSNSSSSDEANHDDTSPTSSMPSISMFQAEKEKPLIDNKKSQTSPSNKKSRMTVGNVSGMFLRCVLLDVPLLTLFILLTISILVEKAKNDYLLPQLNLVKWTEERAEQEITYYRRKCTANDVSTYNAQDLYIDMPNENNENGTGGGGGDTIESAVEKMNIHGASIYPNLLSPETANQVRDFILAENLNKNQDMIYVIENKNRWSFGIQVDDDPSIAKALSEILSHEFLVKALEKLVGENPAVIEFTGITSAYGAAEQAMHQDVIPDGSGAQFARNFVPSYSLFIPLQNTTRRMGATHICPGTHMCATGANPVCEEYGFPVSGPLDNWPLGYGALVCQQTTHRGAGHFDPHGEPRVLFILTFAPRPRYGPKQVETRILGNGGSYSLHWSQWGHTLRDYANATLYMSRPWRHLRSLGIYKPADRQWGWDYLASSSQRIVHEEAGFNAEDFFSTLKKGRFDWIPTFLRPVEKMKKRPHVPGPKLWIEFLQAALANFVDFFKYWYPRALAAYTATLLLVHVLLALLTHRRGLWKDFTLLQTAGRLIFWHSLIASFAWLYYYRHVGTGSWARNIKRNLHARTMTFTVLDNPILPSTLPSTDDVLDLQDYQSNYLAAFTNVLDYNHPGNFKWQGMIQGYEQLDPSLQGKLCSSLNKWSKQYNKARLLTKNSFNQWSEMTPSLADRFCHKQVLSRPKTTTAARVIQWTDYLLSETRFGYWHESALHMLHIPKMLRNLQDKLMHYDATMRGRRHNGRPKAHLRPLSTAAHNKQPTSSKTTPFFSTKSVTSTSVQNKTARTAGHSALPPQPAIEQPNKSAWLQEGDIVEGQYNGQFDEYYRGRIDFANAYRGTWDVQYDDGEWDVGLCRQCVQPFIPYHVGENLEWRDDSDDSDNFFKCEVVAVYNKDGVNISVDVKLLPNGKILKGVLPKQLRRKLSAADRAKIIKPGVDVQALFPEGPAGLFYPGRIREDLGEGMFVVDFEDGDVAEVHVKDIQPLME